MVRIINLPGSPPGGDVVDWIDAGNEPGIIGTLRPGPPARRHSAEALWNMSFPPAKFAMPGYISEGLTLLAGARKRGKSWHGARRSAALAAMGGYTPGDQHCIEGDAPHCALEDSPRRIKDRLHKVPTVPSTRRAG